MGQGTRPLAAWAGAGLALALPVLAFVPWSHAFGYDFVVAEMPVLELVAGLMATGLLVPLLPRLVRLAGDLAPPRKALLLAGMVLVGLALRLALLASDPALEDDYQRYLLDGGAVVAGLDPYAIVPAEALDADPQSSLGRLATAAGDVLERINHRELSTVYPPVAQAAFALAHLIGPYQLWAWRLVCLTGEIASLALILWLLRRIGREPLWAALYWWNPLVIKELANSAHMEAILLPLVLGAVALLTLRRHASAAFVLALAAGVKFWPVLLLPLLVAPLRQHPIRLLAALAAFALPAALIALPMAGSALGPSSGLLAYASGWKTNSAIFPLIETLVSPVAGPSGAGLLARGVVGLTLAAIVCVVAWHARAAEGEATIRAAALTTGALFLLSPAQFPWYATWVAVFLPFLPSRAFLWLGVMMPLYYVAFHLIARDQLATFASVVVPLEWAPILALLAIGAISARTPERR